MASSFLSPGNSTSEGQIASLHLSRALSLPVLLSTTAATAAEQGYAEGVVTNTKFGSFPHSTLLNVPWGSQIRASQVDTGSRGRDTHRSFKKRKADAISTDSPAGLSETGSPRQAPGQGQVWKEATLAHSGYAHLLPPTPENWTTSLPHRTQVVYTPDYSYILHRIRARPGTVLIEAGSGSGSFTHAAVRAVYDGILEHRGHQANGELALGHVASSRGRVYSYEFHPERHEKLEQEMQQHRLSHLVVATHRDVYKDGFLLQKGDSSPRTPLANAIFLDLPAPWEALQHLTREGRGDDPSPLDPSTPVHICTFSPCIEQVQKTISCMRKLGWIDIEMVEMQHKRIEVRREFTGLKYDGMRSVNAYAVDVDEAVNRLRVIEQRAKAFHAISGDETPPVVIKSKAAAQNAQVDAAKTLYNEGIIIHRSEPELKTHTSYLVFAILPRSWTAEDEEKARAMLQLKIQAAAVVLPKTQRQLKKEANLRKRAANGIGKPR